MEKMCTYVQAEIAKPRSQYINGQQRSAWMSVFEERPSNDFRFLLKLPDKRLLLSCHSTNSVLVLDSNGKQVSAISGWFSKPEGLALVDDHVFVVDRYNHCIHVFNANTLDHITAFGGPGQEPGMFNQPVGIAVGEGGVLWVADNENHRVQALTRTGQHIKTLGFTGMISNDPGSFFCPCGVATYTHPQHGELVLVSEWGGHRVQVFRGDKVFAIYPGIQNAHSLYVEKGVIHVSEYGSAGLRKYYLDGERIQLEHSAVSLSASDGGMLVVERHRLIRTKREFTARKRPKIAT